MKRIYCLFVSILILLLSIFSLRAQNTEGTEFWLTFSKQLGYIPLQVQLGAFDMQIRIVGGNQPTTSGSICFTELGIFHDFTVNAYEVYDYSLNSNERLAVYNDVSDNINNKSIYITTTNPVTVYAYRSSQELLEITNILPVTALGTEHIQISYTRNYVVDDAYAVVATQNNTLLEHNGTPVGTLNAGQVYYRSSSFDMTGDKIVSNKPVAFFAVHQGASIPQPAGGLSCFLVQQLPPVNTWGKTFFVPVTICGKEIVRIVASQNGTNITQMGGMIRTDVSGAQLSLEGLQAGQFVELEITLDSAGCYIYANNPIGVCSYMETYNHTGFHSTPSQVWIPAIEQTVSKALIAPFVPNNPIFLLTHYALIITPTITKNDTKVSIGGALPTPMSGGGSWYDNPTAYMSFYSMPLDSLTSSYVFTNPAGIIILGYCSGTTPGDWPLSSYYLAGSAMRDLDAAFYANDIHFQDLKDNSMCAGEVEFRAEIEGLHPTHPERLTWWIDSVEYLPAKNLEQWSKPFSVGEYEIEMKVRYENDEITSKTGTLIVHSCNQSAAFYMNNVYYQIDTTFCDKNVNFHADIEGLHPTDPESIMWYIDNVFETSAASWNKTFENGTYEIKLVVHYDNDTYATLIGTLKVKVFWVKMRNIKH